MIERQKESLLPDRPRTSALLEEQVATLQNRVEKYFPGAKYAVFWSHEEHRMIAAPPWFITSSEFGHSQDYGSGIFEGTSAMVNERTGIPHVILLGPRSDRLFHKSLPSRGYESPASQEQFNQAILDVVAINGMDIFKDPKGTDKLVRAYIRPTIHPAALAGFGVSMRPGYPIDAAIITWAWPDYLNPKVYTEGMNATITGHQRLFPVTGKHASNYGSAGTEGALVRSLGIDELIYLAPYLINEQGNKYWTDPNDHDAKLKDGVLADGPGEEIFAITADGKTMIYPPMSVNRLGGTVLEYVCAFMAPNLGIETEERDITMHDLRAGKYVSLGMIGNAVKIAPVRFVQLFDKNRSVYEQFEFAISEPMQRLMDRWDGETRGRIDPSHPTLLTPVDMERGKHLREQLDNIFLFRPRI